MEARQAVCESLARGWPLVARSRAVTDAPGVQAAGLCLPLAQGKRRIALAVRGDQIASVEEPAPLEAVADVLPPPAAALARELAALAQSLGFTARAFGSAAWQWRTGEPYLTPSSDLDLLAPAGNTGLGSWLDQLRASEGRSPMRLDGEIEGSDGDAVNWREWASEATRVLVKSATGARLVDRATLSTSWR